MGAKRLLLFIVIVLTGCTTAGKAQPVTRIALLAPFEGRYREIGYDALYAARLAINDSGYDDLDLLAVDDGGSITAAVERAQAIHYDPAIAFTLVLGPYATSEVVQQELDRANIIIIGHWNSRPVGANAVMLASVDISSQLTLTQTPSSIVAAAHQEQPTITSELLALKQIPLLNNAPDYITVLSSASLPDETFEARYIESDPFAPQPGLLASLTYDAAMIAAKSIEEDIALQDIQYSGINGAISFENGYWKDAPLHRYTYNNGILTAVPVD